MAKKKKDNEFAEDKAENYNKRIDDSVDTSGYAIRGEQEEQNKVNAPISNTSNVSSNAENGVELAEITQNNSISQNNEVNKIADSQNIDSEFVDPRNGVKEYHTTEEQTAESIPVEHVGASKGEAMPYEPTQEDIRNEAKIAGQMPTQGEDTDEEDVVEVERDANGIPYNSKDPNVRLLQDLGVYNPNEQDVKAYNDYLANAPEATSEKEEERIIKAKQAAQGASNFASLIAALANVYNTGKGAISQVMPDVKPFDYEGLRDKYRKGRQALSAYKNGAIDYINKLKAQRQKMELDKQKADALAQYNRARGEYQQAKADYEKIRAEFANNNGGLTPEQAQRLDIAYKNLSLKEQGMNEAARHHQVMEGIAQLNANTSSRRANAYIARQGGGGNGSTISIVVPEWKDENGDVHDSMVHNVSKSTWNENREALARATGVPLTELRESLDGDRTVRRDPNQIDKEILDNWNPQCDDIINSIHSDVRKADTSTSTTVSNKAKQKDAKPNANANSTPKKEQSQQSEDMNKKAQDLAKKGIKFEF